MLRSKLVHMCGNIVFLVSLLQFHMLYYFSCAEVNVNKGEYTFQWTIANKIGATLIRKIKYFAKSYILRIHVPADIYKAFVDD